MMTSMTTNPPVAETHGKDAARRGLTVAGVAGRLLLAVAGLAVGILIGWIAGVELGLIHFSC